MKFTGRNKKWPTGNIHDVRYGQFDPPVGGSGTTGNIHDVRDGNCELIDSRSTTGRSMTPERVNVKAYSNQSRWADHVADLHTNTQCS